MQKVFARVVIKNKNNHILVIQDREHFWSFPGGKQELGETPMECAKREIQEEVGLSVEQLVEIYQDHFYFDDVQWTGYFYFAEVVSGVLTNNEPYKIKEMRFVNRYEQAKFPPQLDDLAQKIFLQHLIDDRQTAWL